MNLIVKEKSFTAHNSIPYNTIMRRRERRKKKKKRKRKKRLGRRINHVKDNKGKRQ